MFFYLFYKSLKEFQNLLDSERFVMKFSRDIKIILLSKFKFNIFFNASVSNIKCYFCHAV